MKIVSNYSWMALCSKRCLPIPHATDWPRGVQLKFGRTGLATPAAGGAHGATIELPSTARSVALNRH